MTASDSSHAAKPPRRKLSWKGKFFLILSPVLLLVALDGAMHLLGITPPDDPLTFYMNTFARDFSPLVESEEGVLTVKPDWTNNGETYLSRRGALEGRAFLYPGFRSCEIKKQKDPGTIRIFTFGGSTTFGLFVGKDLCFSALLRDRFRADLPDRNLEVINLGCPGVESTRVNVLMDTALTLEPDLLIVYSGLNELLQGGVAGPALTFTEDLRGKLLSLSTVYRWISYFIGSYREGRAYEGQQEDMAALGAGNLVVYDPRYLSDERQRLPDPARLQAAEPVYQANLKSMIAKARGHDVPILFVLPLNNLLAPPAISAHAEGFTGHAPFQEFMQNAEQALQEKRGVDALHMLDKALALSERYAHAWYLKGKARILLGQEEKALSDLQAACDHDVRTHHITSGLQATLIRTMEEEGAPWIDLRPMVHPEFIHPPEEPFFVDHCHPTRRGHEVIANQIHPAARDLLNLD